MDNLSEEDQETIREFLVESDENLSQLDQDLVELEKRPNGRGAVGQYLSDHSHHQGNVRVSGVYNPGKYHASRLRAS